MYSGHKGISLQSCFSSQGLRSCEHARVPCKHRRGNITIQQGNNVCSAIAILAFHYSLARAAKVSGRARTHAYREKHRGNLLKFRKGIIVCSAIAIGAFCVKGEVNITCSSQIPSREHFIMCVNDNSLYNCVMSDFIYNTNRYSSLHKANSYNFFIKEYLEVYKVSHRDASSAQYTIVWIQEWFHN